jgi:hypothetical protein
MTITRDGVWVGQPPDLASVPMRTIREFLDDTASRTADSLGSTGCFRFAPPPTPLLVHSQEASLPSASRCQTTGHVPPPWFLATSTVCSETGFASTELAAGRGSPRFFGPRKGPVSRPIARFAPAQRYTLEELPRQSGPNLLPNASEPTPSPARPDPRVAHRPWDRAADASRRRCQWSFLQGSAT